MATNIQKLSRLMKISWEIQRSKHSTRSKPLQSAWAIISNEDITIYYLTQKLNHHKPVKEKVLNQMGLYTR